MSGNANDSGHARSPMGTFSDTPSGDMVVGGRIFSQTEQIDAGIGSATDRTSAEIILTSSPATAPAAVDGGDAIRGLVIYGPLYLAALLIAFGLKILGVPDSGSIAIQYLAFVTVGAFAVIWIANESRSQAEKTWVVGALIVAQSTYALYHFFQVGFGGSALTGLLLNGVRIAIGVAVVRRLPIARVGYLVMAVIPVLMVLVNTGLSLKWSFVALFRSPLGLPATALIVLLLYCPALRNAFKK